jgi:hypothetical protein
MPRLGNGSRCAIKAQQGTTLRTTEDIQSLNHDELLDIFI